MLANPSKSANVPPRPLQLSAVTTVNTRRVGSRLVLGQCLGHRIPPEHAEQVRKLALSCTMAATTGANATEKDKTGCTTWPRLQGSFVIAVQLWHRAVFRNQNRLPRNQKRRGERIPANLTWLNVLAPHRRQVNASGRFSLSSVSFTNIQNHRGIISSSIC